MYTFSFAPPAANPHSASDATLETHCATSFSRSCSRSFSCWSVKELWRRSWKETLLRTRTIALARDASSYLIHSFPQNTDSWLSRNLVWFRYRSHASSFVGWDHPSQYYLHKVRAHTNRILASAYVTGESKQQIVFKKRFFHISFLSTVRLGRSRCLKEQNLALGREE